MKFYGELFWNICDFLEVESMQKEAHIPHKTPGHAVVSYSYHVSQLGLYFGRKESYIRKKILLKSQRNRSYGSPDI